MGENLYFISGDKSFELTDAGDKNFSWYTIIERSRRFTSRIKLDDSNLRWVCNILKQASRGTGDLYRRWGRKQQAYLYRVYQNYNIYGRYIRIEAWLGDRKSAIIIPEIDYNYGWSDLAEKILRYLEKQGKSGLFPPPAPMQKSFFDAAKIESWPLDSVHATEMGPEDKHPLSRCLIGTFNDPFSHSPNPEVIHKWFLNRWKICASLRVTPLDHNRFLFELPSKQEAARILAGDWYWNGRHLKLEWWSLKLGSERTCKNPENIWIKALGIPLNAWSSETFKTIGDMCGGFVGIDEDTRCRTHFFWARVCVLNSGEKIPMKLVFPVGEWCFDITIVEETQAIPKPVGQKGDTLTLVIGAVASTSYIKESAEGIAFNSNSKKANPSTTQAQCQEVGFLNRDIYTLYP